MLDLHLLAVADNLSVVADWTSGYWYVLVLLFLGFLGLTLSTLEAE